MVYNDSDQYTSSIHNTFDPKYLGETATTYGYRFEHPSIGDMYYNNDSDQYIMWNGQRWVVVNDRVEQRSILYNR